MQKHSEKHQHTPGLDFWLVVSLNNLRSEVSQAQSGLKRGADGFNVGLEGGGLHTKKMSVVGLGYHTQKNDKRYWQFWTMPAAQTMQVYAIAQFSFFHTEKTHTTKSTEPLTAQQQE